MAASVLWRAAHEAQYQPLDRALDALEVVGLPRAAFFSELAREEAAGSGPLSPLTWLRFYRDKSPGDAFLEEIKPSLLELVASPFETGGKSCRGELRQIEGCRFEDPLGARKALEAKILELVAGFSVETLPSTSLLADLATALAMRGSIHRQRGQLGAATDDLLLAYELAARAGDPWVLGLWHQKAPWLLFEAGRYDLALELLEPALRHFFAATAFEEANQLFVDRGILLVELGRCEEAKAEYALALERLGESSWRHRLAVHLNLALIHQKEGHLEPALRELELAAQASRERGLGFAFLRRRGGEILAALGRHSLAIPCLEEALELMTTHGEASDVVGVALELAEAFILVGERKKAHALARDIGEVLSKKREDAWIRAARAAFDDLVALAELGRLSGPEVAEVRMRVAAGLLPPRRARRAAQD